MRWLGWLVALVASLWWWRERKGRGAERPPEAAPRPTAPPVQDDEGLPPVPRPVPAPGVWPAFALLALGVLVVLLGVFTHPLVTLLGALLVVGGALGWAGAAQRARRPSTDEERRRLLAGLSLGLGGLAATVAAIPIVGTLVAPVETGPQRAWRTVGRAGAWRVGEVRLVSFPGPRPLSYGGGVRDSAAWLRRDSDTGFTAFALNCTHLGCPVRWEAGAGLFFCPCHGGVFDDQGRAVAGPPRIGLRRLRTRVVRGEVQVEAAPIPLPALRGA